MGDSAIVALQHAIKFESDGRAFYLDAAERLTNPVARTLFASLAEEEKSHIKRVREIYEELKDKPGWPTVEAMVARQAGTLDAFEKALEDPGALTPDMDARQALGRALEMEHEGLTFYKDRLCLSTCDGENSFFTALIEEEEEHIKAIEAALARIP